jgi:hypothetical protein
MDHEAMSGKGHIAGCLDLSWTRWGDCKLKAAVTVLIPTCNRAQFLSECLSSVSGGEAEDFDSNAG